jgi:hypothetical protein
VFRYTGVAACNGLSPHLAAEYGEIFWQARPPVILSAAKNLRCFATQRRSFAALWMTAYRPGLTKKTCHAAAALFVAVGVWYSFVEIAPVGGAPRGLPISLAKG